MQAEEIRYQTERQACDVCGRDLTEDEESTYGPETQYLWLCEDCGSEISR